MSDTIQHFSRQRVENTTLQVIADTQRNLDRLIREEVSVIRHYVRQGPWPHKWVNMFVLDDLRPLVSQIRSITSLSSALIEDIDHRPMVNIYDAADLSECAVFVNRRVLKRDGVWSDALALRALLAHEHGHPLAENETVHAARALAVEVVVESPTAKAAVGEILNLLADRLCVHAPQEVFANEIAIRAGFGDALFHLDKGTVEKACLGVAKRAFLVQGLDRQVRDGKLTTAQVAALLLVGDLQAHLGFALETAPFLAAGHQRQAKALETALSEGVWRHLDPAVLPLYETFRDHYLQLKVDLTPAKMKAWATTAVGFFADALEEKHLQVRFKLVRTRSGQKRSRKPPSQAMTGHDNALEQDRGSP